MNEYGNPPQDEQGGRYENAPFKKGLEYMFHPHANIGVSNEILVNAEAQGLVVRAADLDMYYENTAQEGVEQATSEKDAEHIHRVETEAAKAKKIYDELADEYGINIPKFMYVIGEARLLTGTDWSDPDAPTYMTRYRPGKAVETKVREEGDSEPMLYTISEKVIGGSLSHLEYVEEKPTPEDYIELYGTMTRYIVDKLLNQEPFFSDFGDAGVRMDEQFMFGHIKNTDDAPDTEYTNQIWLVDVDPKVFDPADINNEDERQIKLRKMFKYLCSEVGSLQEQLNGDYSSLNTIIREQVQRLSDTYPEAAEKFLGHLPK